MDLCKVLTGRGWLDYQLVDWELMTRMTRERGSYLTGLSLRYPCQASSGYFVCRSGSPDSSACQGRSSLQSNGQRDAQRWQTLWGEDDKYVEMSVGLPRDGDWWTTMSMFSVCVKMSEFSLFPIQLKKVKLNFTMLWLLSSYFHSEYLKPWYVFSPPTWRAFATKRLVGALHSNVNQWIFFLPF